MSGFAPSSRRAERIGLKRSSPRPTKSCRRSRPDTTSAHRLLAPRANVQGQWRRLTGPIRGRARTIRPIAKRRMRPGSAWRTTIGIVIGSITPRYCESSIRDGGRRSPQGPRFGALRRRRRLRPRLARRRRERRPLRRRPRRDRRVRRARLLPAVPRRPLDRQRLIHLLHRRPGSRSRRHRSKSSLQRALSLPVRSGTRRQMRAPRR